MSLHAASLCRKLWAPSIAATLALLSLGMGCRASRSFATSPTEYAAYRQTRVAPGLAERLRASAEYLERYPNGAFVDSVRARLVQAEPVYFAVKQESEAGLEEYLSVLPRGPHAEQAAERLALLRARRDAPDILGDAAVATRVRLDEARKAREIASSAPLEWVARFAAPATFQRPLTEAPAETLVPWSLSLPAPRCEWVEGLSGKPERVCIKTLEHPYRVTGSGGMQDRTLRFEIILTEDERGVPTDVWIGGPDLFVRMREARDNRALDEGDVAVRINAIAWIKDAADDRLLALWGAPRREACRAPAVAPVVLSFACEGTELRVIAAGDDSSDDGFALRALRPSQHGPPADVPGDADSSDTDAPGVDANEPSDPAGIAP